MKVKKRSDAQDIKAQYLDFLDTLEYDESRTVISEKDSTRIPASSFYCEKMNKPFVMLIPPMNNKYYTTKEERRGINLWLNAIREYYGIKWADHFPVFPILPYVLEEHKCPAKNLQNHGIKKSINLDYFQTFVLLGSVVQKYILGSSPSLLIASGTVTEREGKRYILLPSPFLSDFVPSQVEEEDLSAFVKTCMEKMKIMIEEI